MAEGKAELRGLDPAELKELITAAGEQPFRAQQLFNWIQVKAVRDWSEIKNLRGETLASLKELAALEPLTLISERVSRDGTRKYLWQLADGKYVESVLLFHEGDQTRTRYTLCLSTQVGCPMGCAFCATGKLGYQRNLTAGEIISQVLDVSAHNRIEDREFKINNLVYMGMGEPLLNLPAVLKSIKILNHKEGQNIGIRRITVSTCGLVPQMDILARENLDIVLAVSLHAPNNKLRNTIMPVNRQYPLEVLIPACRRFTEKTGRRITLEYALIQGFNDGPEHVRQLAGLLKGLLANVNIIPVNQTDLQKGNEGTDFRQPRPSEVREFVKNLEGLGVKAVIREEKGSDIEAACGQLAGAYHQGEARAD